jgi:hypothetical protein
LGASVARRLTIYTVEFILTAAAEQVKAYNQMQISKCLNRPRGPPHKSLGQSISLTLLEGGPLYLPDRSDLSDEKLTYAVSKNYMYGLL